MNCEGLAEAKGRVILTPHPGEFSRLSGKPMEKIRNNPIPLAEEFARKHGVTLLLKGPATIVTDGTETILTDRGAPGMASGGSGDVLSGIITALLAQGLSAFDAASVGAFLLGASADVALELLKERALIARDVIEVVERTIEGL